MWYSFSYGLFNLDLIKKIAVLSKDNRYNYGKEDYCLIGWDVNDNQNRLESFATRKEAEAEFEKVCKFLTEKTGG